MKKGMLINVLAAFVLSFAFSMFIASPVKGAGEPDSWYKNPSTGVWYYYDENGAYLTGLQYIDGEMYYFDNYGEMQVNVWKKELNGWMYFKANGKRAMSEFLYINGYWYYFNGAYMVADCVYDVYENGERNSYRFDASGRMQTNSWYLNPDGRWMYFKQNGAAAYNELLKIGNDYYGFDYFMIKDRLRIFNNNAYGFGADGKAVKGWKKFCYDEEREKNEWYYFGNDCKGVSGWFSENGKWYYASCGFAYYGGRYPINQYYYCFDKDCAMITGWYQDRDGKWYFYESDGRMATDKWVVYDGKWCYLKSDGTAACDEVVMIGDSYYGFSSYYMISDSISWVGDYIYYFGTDGKAATGWYRYVYGDKKDRYIWYYFQKDGKGYNGWHYENGKWYYLVNGYAYCDVIREINNSYYCFDSSCAMITGWKTVKNYEYVCIYNETSGRCEYEYYEKTPSYYYFDKDGSGANGWRTIEDKTYYFKDGCAYSNCTYSIDGKTYVFNINASLASGWTTLKHIWYDINTKETVNKFIWYYANDDGTVYTGWVDDGNSRYYVKESYMYCNGWYIIDNKSYYFNKNGELSATA